jgi:hypothetical protein
VLLVDYLCGDDFQLVPHGKAYVVHDFTAVGTDAFRFRQLIVNALDRQAGEVFLPLADALLAFVGDLLECGLRQRRVRLLLGLVN